MLKVAQVSAIFRTPVRDGIFAPRAPVRRLSTFTGQTSYYRAAPRSQPLYTLRKPWKTPSALVRGVRHNSTAHKAQQKAQGLGARLKELSRKYGWATVGVYAGLSVLDFPLCFLAVQLFGTDRIAEAEHFVVDGFWKLVGMVGLGERKKEATPAYDAEADLAEVAQREHNDASIWTQLLLAYGVHKSLIVFRVPITAAITPKIVKWLRARGWKIGNPKVS